MSGSTFSVEMITRTPARLGRRPRQQICVQRVGLDDIGLDCGEQPIQSIDD